jgi:hypothetical protein
MLVYSKGYLVIVNNNDSLFNVWMMISWWTDVLLFSKWMNVVQWCLIKN